MRNVLRDVGVEKLNNNYIYYLKGDTVSYNILQKTKKEGKGFFPKYDVDEMIKTVRRYGDTAHVITRGGNRYISIVNKKYGVINKSITLGSVMDNVETSEDGWHFVAHPISDKMFTIYEKYELELHSMGSPSSYLKAAIDHYEAVNMQVILDKRIYFNGLLFMLTEKSVDQYIVHPLKSGFDFETEFRYDEKSSMMQQLEYHLNHEYLCSLIALREYRFDKGEITVLTQDHDNRRIKLRFNPTGDSEFDYLTFSTINTLVKMNSWEGSYIQNMLRSSLITYKVVDKKSGGGTNEIRFCSAVRPENKPLDAFSYGKTPYSISSTVLGDEIEFGMNEGYRERMKKEEKSSKSNQSDDKSEEPNKDTKPLGHVKQGWVLRWEDVEKAIGATEPRSFEFPKTQRPYTQTNQMTGNLAIKPVPFEVTLNNGSKVIVNGIIVIDDEPHYVHVEQNGTQVTIVHKWKLDGRYVDHERSFKP